MFIVKFCVISVLLLICNHVESASTNTHICFGKHRTADGKRTKDCCAGYIRDDAASEERDILVCKPICMPACINATCINPGQCECNPGYRANAANGHICEPVCKPIPFSNCIAPDTISCNHGYILVNNTCQPVCTEPCLFGKCIAPESCQCYPGYRLSDANICEPYCSRGCSHGTCRAPDMCECDDGWTSFEGLCVCNKTCENGTCIDPDTCKCDFILLDVCVKETRVDVETTTYLDESTNEPEMTTEYDDAQANLSVILFDRKGIEYRNDSIMDPIASQSKSNCYWSWLWIVILVLLLMLLIAACAYKWRTMLSYWKGKSYNVGEYEARECRRNDGQHNIEINYLKNK